MTHPMGILKHYSRDPLEAVYDVVKQSRRDFKPTGLWISVESEGDSPSWREWCEYEGFHADSLRHETELCLAPNAKVLRLEGADDIDWFTTQYGIDGLINWSLVSKHFDGIIIAPYCYERRYSDHTLWYNGWDIASGCIWRSRAIEIL